MAERPEVHAVQQVQHLQQHGPLAPEAAGEDLVRAEARGERGADLHLEAGQVLERERPALGAVERGDAPRGLAPVDLVARGADAGRAATAGAPLGLGHARERLAELRLHENLAGPVRTPVAQEQRGGRRPAAVLLGVRRHLVRREARHGEATARVLGRGRRDVGERHRAPALERGEPRGGRGGHDRAREARRDLAAVPLAEVREARGARVRPDAGHLERRARPREVHEDRRHAGHADHVGVHDAEREPGGDPRVDRVAAGGEHARGGLGGERVAGGDRPARADRLHGRRRRVEGRGLLVGRGVEAHGSAP